MMHASTSPLYVIIASNDVAEGRRGDVLTQESIDEAVAFRQTLARVARELGDDWFFRPWQPDNVRTDNGAEVTFADAPADVLAIRSEVWHLKGENAGAADGAFIGYLRALEEFDRLFPGFEHDLHGVDHVGGDYVITCVEDS